MNRVLALDPGSLNCGYAVLELSLTGDENLITSGVCRTRHMILSQRIPAMLRMIKGLFTEHAPAVVAYETFVFFGDRRVGENDIKAGYKVHQIIGAIKMEALNDPYPEVMSMLPQVWGRQLTGSQMHSKDAVAATVSRRLGREVTAADGGHSSDAIGIGMVALDQWRQDQHIKRSEALQKMQDLAQARRL